MMNITDDKTNWPAVIRHGEDPELSFIADQSAWLEYTSHEDPGTDDSVIDSSGHRYEIIRNGGEFRLQADGSVTLTELLGLVKAHAAASGSCCVAKLYAPTIEEALKIVASLQDQ
jgi:hypothetical protein